MSWDISLINNNQEVFDTNITRNLSDMICAANLFQVLYEPSSMGASRAKDITPALEEGIRELENYPEHFEGFEISTRRKSGSYQQLVKHLRDYHQACVKYPDALIEVTG